MDFDVTDKLLVLYSAFVKCLRKNLNKIGQCISYLLVSDEFMIRLGDRFCLISH